MEALPLPDELVPDPLGLPNEEALLVPVELPDEDPDPDGLPNADAPPPVLEPP